MRERSPWRRWPSLFRKDPASDVDEELSFHVEERVREYVARGMDEESARRAAMDGWVISRVCEANARLCSLRTGAQGSGAPC